jgi:hypothetical protein
MVARMAESKATGRTEAKWVERVRAWRASGESARDFANRHGFAESTLHGWSSRLSRPDTPGFLRLVPRPAAAAAPSEMIVEVGPARIRVASGFDAALLEDVVRALGGGAR